MKDRKRFDLGNLSAARPHLLGLATLWIALFHSWHLDLFQIPLLSRIHLLGLLNRLRETGNCGVDLFLFLSGLGLVYSWEKLQGTSARPLSAFYGKRLRRILPPVLLVLLIYYGITGTEGTEDWLGKVFLYGHFSAVLDGGRGWYFALLIPLYLLFPAIHLSLKKGGIPALAGWLAASVGGALLLRALAPAYFDKTEILWTRIPVFLLGVFFGQLSFRRVSVPGWVPVLALPLAAAVWLAVFRIPGGETLFLRRYAYAPLALCIALSHAWLCSLSGRRGPVHRAVTRIGGLSLEIYLIFENLYMADPPLFRGADPAGVTYGLAVFAAALLLSCLLHLAVEWLTRQGEANLPSPEKGSDLR